MGSWAEPPSAAKERSSGSSAPHRWGPRRGGPAWVRGVSWPSSGSNTGVTLEESFPVSGPSCPQLKDGKVGLDRLHVPLSAQTFCDSQCNPELTCQEHERCYWVSSRGLSEEKA